MRVTLCTPLKNGGLTRRELTFNEGATVAQALTDAGLPPETECGLFCEKTTAEMVLHEGDRLDVAVALRLSPMDVRRLRAENKERTSVPKPRHGGIHQLIKPLEESTL